MPPSLLDTDTLSEVMKGRDPQVQRRARQCLASYGCFTFSIITRYEILRGLKAKGTTRQIAIFEERCRKSIVLPLTDEIVVRVADIYAVLHRKGQLISDADILIVATALTHGLTLVTRERCSFPAHPWLES
jgi:tRNA(fMet)-specific endonuclease VapC